MQSDRYLDMAFSQNLVKGEKETASIYCTESVDESSFGLFNKRLDGVTVRSYFTQKIYDYVIFCASKEKYTLKEHEEKVFKIKLPYIMEGVMTILYHYNQLWDGKNNIKPQNQPEVHIGANLLRTALLKYVYNGPLNDQYKCELMYKVIERSIHYVDAGQYIDKYGNNYDCFLGLETKRNKVKNEEDLISKETAEFINLSPFETVIEDIQSDIPDKKNFIELYFKRLYLISSSLFRIVSEFIMDSIEYFGKQRKKIIQFAEYYGMMMQIVNDNADFAPEKGTASKMLKDVFSDLKNYNITLPLMYHLSSENRCGFIQRFLETNESSYLENYNKILKEIVTSGAIFKSIEIGKSLARMGRKMLIDKKEDSTKFLIQMLSIAFKNRYYFHFDKAKECYEVGLIYDYEKHLFDQKKTTLKVY